MVNKENENVCLFLTLHNNGAFHEKELALCEIHSRSAQLIETLDQSYSTIILTILLRIWPFD